MTRPHLPTIVDVRASAEHCSYNAKLCRSACPVAAATGKESVTPWGINRAITAAADAGAVSEATAAAVYGCTGCRACGGLCLHGVDLPTNVRAARAAVVTAGLAPAGVAEATGVVRAPAGELAAGSTAGASTVVYPGCRSADGVALAAVLGAAEEPYDVVAAPTCCGARSVDIGYVDQGTQEAEDLRHRLAPAERIVVADPHCARWLRVDHADERVVTLPQFVASLVERLDLRPPDAPVAWHDPCWMGRGMGIYDQPRAVLAAAGARLVEPAHTRDHGRCTGGGMGYPEADPEGAKGVLAGRAEELRAVVGDDGTVVTGCPTAASRLRSAGLDAHDLAGWLAARLVRRSHE